MRCTRSVRIRKELSKHRRALECYQIVFEVLAIDPRCGSAFVEVIPPCGGRQSIDVSERQTCEKI